MTATVNTYLQEIDAQIQSKHLLNHPWYHAWSKGELSIEGLREYAKDYYQHVKAFPTYLSAIHCRCEDAGTRRMLLQNLVEEEAGSPNHPELWKNFALGLGVTEDELQNHQPSPEMENLVGSFRAICRQQTVAEGIGALYAYESQIPDICVSKIDGLKKFYDRTNPKDWEYFSVHIAADKEHAAQERRLLETHISEENYAAVQSSVNQTLDALWNFLTGMCHRYGISMNCA